MESVNSRCMQGKVVVVTGAGGGIGRDIALLMARCGASVVVNDIGVSLQGDASNAGAALAVVKEIEADGGRAAANTDSVSEAGSGDRIVADAIKAFGRLDAVVNNAGIIRDRFFHKMSDEEWDAVIKVHLYGSWNLSRAAGAVFKEQGSGSFVHMTSTSGLIGNRGQANYAAAKMGIVGLSRSIALDMARFQVRSNCIAPSAWTRMIESVPLETPEQRARAERKMQLMTTQKVAPLAVHLASDASSGISGQIFGVRGNELFVFDQPRPVRYTHSASGWTPESIAEVAMPALKSGLVPLEDQRQVFHWEPV